MAQSEPETESDLGVCMAYENGVCGTDAVDTYDGLPLCQHHLDKADIYGEEYPRPVPQSI